MRRFIGALGVASMLAGGPFVVSALASPSAPAMAGRLTQSGGMTRIHAHGLDSAATGKLVAVGVFRAKVTCLEVAGNDGIATAVITASQDPNNPVGETVVAEGVDNSAQATTDLWRISFANNGGIFPDAANPGCFLPFFAPVPIDAGHIRVRS
jgi:hypothetical protein